MAVCANIHCKREDKTIPDGEQVCLWLPNRHVAFLCKECNDVMERDNSIRLDMNGDVADYTVHEENEGGK